MLRHVTAVVGLLLLGTGFGCATSSAPAETLQGAVSAYNEGLRWKRFAQAAEFVDSARRADFLRGYLGSEEDLHIESIEVRAVNELPNQAQPTFLVTVVAESYRLPSTVLAKTVMVQRWEQHEGAWVLSKCEPELTP